jgi:hypothetical protein
MGSRWDRTIGDTTITISCCKGDASSPPTDDTSTYSISIPPETGGVANLDITHQPDARWTADLNATGIGDDDQLLITVPDDTCY